MPEYLAEDLWELIEKFCGQNYSLNNQNKLIQVVVRVGQSSEYTFKKYTDMKEQRL